MSTAVLNPKNWWGIDYGGNVVNQNASPTTNGLIIEYDIDNAEQYAHAAIIGAKVNLTVGTITTSTAGSVYWFAYTGTGLPPIVGSTVHRPWASELTGVYRGFSYAKFAVSGYTPGSVGADAQRKIGQLKYSDIKEGKLFAYLPWTRNTDKTPGTLELEYGSAITDFSVAMDLKTGSFLPYTSEFSISFSVTSSQNESCLGTFNIIGGTLYYKKYADSNYSSIAFNGSKCTIPENTLSGGEEYQIYAVCTTYAGVTAQTEVGTYKTTDGSPACTAVSPSNEITYGSVTFQWEYSVSTGRAQYAYDLQVSSDGSAWSDIVNHKISSENSVTVTVPISGALFWQVRCYNQDNTASEWSQLSFINYLPAEAPVIVSITGNGRRTVSWTSSSQIAYHVTVQSTTGNSEPETIYDSGDVYSTVKSHRIEAYLPEGAYYVAVRIATKVGGWSSDSIIAFSAEYCAESMALAVKPAEHGFSLTVKSEKAMNKIYFLRNGVLIGKLILPGALASFLDLYANKSAHYSAVAVWDDDEYRIASYDASGVCSGSYIALKDGTVIDVRFRVDSPTEISADVSADINTVYYLNRTRPHHIPSGILERKYNISFYDIENRAEGLVGQIVYFADIYGDGGWCIVRSCARKPDYLFDSMGRHINDTALILEETDYREEFIYD